MLSFLALSLFLAPNVASLTNFRNNVCKHYLDYPTWFINPNCHYNPDYAIEPKEVVERNGYSFEKHTVQTKDGYILTVFRVGSPQFGRRSDRQPILLNHGSFVNGRTYINNGNNSLAFYMADAGYDVWVLNVRGTRDSHGHVSLNVMNSKYWLFGLDEIAKYDVGDTLEYIGKKTGKYGSIIYIGYSQGTAVGSMNAVLNAENNIRPVKGMLLLAPVVNFDQIISTVLSTAYKISPIFRPFFYITHIQGILYQTGILRPGISISCRLFPYFCQILINSIGGKSSNQYDQRLLIGLYSNLFDGVSIRTCYHLAQAYLEKKFSKFDFGEKKNVQVYGQTEPPIYDLKKIQIPVFMFNGGGDTLATLENGKRTFNMLGSKLKTIEVIAPGYPLTHQEFFIGFKLREILYPSMLEKMKTHLSM